MRHLGFGLILSCLALPGLAQSSNPPGGSTGPQVRGVIAAVAGNQVSIKAEDGTTQNVSLPADVRLETIQPLTLADIKVGDYVGSGATKAEDGKLTALEVHIFPMKGIGEGQRAMTPDGGRVMTNALITKLTDTPPGKTMVLSFGGRDVSIYLPPGIPVQTFVPATKADILAGKNVNVMTNKDASGALVARTLMMGTDVTRIK